MTRANHEDALVRLYELVEKGTGEHADLLIRVQPLDSDLPEGHYYVSNYTDPASGQSSEQITVSKDALQELSDRRLLTFPYLNKGHGNPFGLSSLGIDLAKKLQSE